MISTIELSAVSRVRASAEVNRPKLALLKQLVLAVSLVLLTSHPAAALDPVSE